MALPDGEASRSALAVLVIADPVPDLNPAHDTSVALIEAAQQRGHGVWTTTAAELVADGGRAYALCRRTVVQPCHLEQARWEAPSNWYELGEGERRELSAFDVILMRTDPPVDNVYLRATYVLDLVDPRGTLLVNDPSGLRNVNEKLFALRVPDLGPDTLVTASIPEIVARVAHWGRAVLKPTDAMGGRGILVLQDGDPNIVSILEMATGRGRDLVVVQRWVDGVDDGDRRIIVLDGRPLGSVRRVAPGADFRCNMATGAVPLADSVTLADEEICAALAPHLARQGIVFAGIDVIGGLLTEVNVTSPTGVREIDALSGSHIADDIVDWIEAACVELTRAEVRQ